MITRILRRSLHPTKQRVDFTRTNMNEKGVIYARVSSREQEETGYSLPAQQKLLEEYAGRRGIAIVKAFSVAESASGVKQRRVFAEAIEFCRANDVSHLLCEKVDRLTRNLKEAVQANEWIEEDRNRNIHFVKNNLILNLNSKSDEKFRWDIEIVLAKKYISNLSEEVKKGQVEKLSQGWLPSKPPLGYLTTGDKGRKTHVIDTTMAPLVREMFELYASGQYPVERLSHEMYSRGLRTRRGYRLVRSRLRDLLTDPFYIGKNRWKDSVFEGKQEALITPDLFNKVQEVSKRKTTTRTLKHDYLFKGVVMCRQCGGVVTWEKQKGIIYGHCNQYRKCKKRTWYKEAEFERIVMSELSDLTVKEPRLAVWITKALKDLHKTESEHRASALAGIQNRHTRLQQQYTTLYKDKLEGLIDGRMYNEMKAMLDIELAGLANAKKRHSDGSQRYYQLGADIFTLSQRSASLFANKQVSLVTKKRMLAVMYHEIYVNDGRLELRLTEAFDELSQIVADLNHPETKERMISQFRIFELSKDGSTKTQNRPFGSAVPTELRG